MLLFYVFGDGRAEGGVWFVCLVGAFGAAFVGWGLLLMIRCVVPAQSRLARVAERVLPDGVGLEEAAFLVVVFLLPAVCVTLLLRWLGVKGQKYR